MRPSVEEAKRMTAKSVEIAVKVVMVVNVYQFANEIRLQLVTGESCAV